MITKCPSCYSRMIFLGMILFHIKIREKSLKWINDAVWMNVWPRSLFFKQTSHLKCKEKSLINECVDECLTPILFPVPALPISPPSPTYICCSPSVFPFLWSFPQHAPNNCANTVLCSTFKLRIRQLENKEPENFYVTWTFIHSFVKSYEKAT